MWASARPWARAAVVVAGVGLAVLACLFLLKWLPGWLATGDLTGKDKAEEVGRTRTAVLAVLAGLIALVGAIYTARTFALNQSGQITERFTRAIEQLGQRDKLEVCLGGIYALEWIARDSPRAHPQVMRVLTAYVREHSPVPPVSPAGADAMASTIESLRTPELERPMPPTDVRAAVWAIGSRDPRNDIPGWRLDLRKTNLRRVDLGGANLQDALVNGADLQGAILCEANLEGADLGGANLQGAHLQEANLQRADLVAANLQGANMGAGDLRRAGANLQDANLAGANLQSAVLWRANLRGADLSRANLQDANLARANLQAVDFGGANFHGATYNAHTRWPDGFDPKAAGAHF